MKIIYKISLLLIIAILLTGCTNPFNKKNNNEQETKIGISNEVNNDKHQFKVIINSINIRKEPNPGSDKLGAVEEGSTFDVIEYKIDDRFIWMHIKTNNDIDGWVASDKKEPYVEFNWEIDFEPPVITLNKDLIESNTRAELPNVLSEHIKYADNKDPNPKFEYEVIDENDPFMVETKIKVTDSSNNVSSKNINIKITGEKKMSNGNLVTYNDMKKLQSKAKIYCYKYSLIANEDRLSCRDLETHITIEPNGIYISNNKSYCNYDINFNPTDCRDNGNDVSYDLMPNNFKSLENTWMKKINEYKEEVKSVTGYDYSELTWDNN